MDKYELKLQLFETRASILRIHVSNLGKYITEENDGVVLFYK